MSPGTARGLPTLSIPPRPSYSQCPSPPSPPGSAHGSPLPLLPALPFLPHPGASWAQADPGPLFPGTWHSAVCGGNWSGPGRRPPAQPQTEPQKEVQAAAGGLGCVRENAHLRPPSGLGSPGTVSRGLRAPRCSPHKLLLDLVCHWLMNRQACVAAERVLSQQHLLNLFVLQGCSGEAERRAWLAHPAGPWYAPPHSNEEA